MKTTAMMPETTMMALRMLWMALGRALELPLQPAAFLTSAETPEALQTSLDAEAEAFDAETGARLNILRLKILIKTAKNVLIILDFMDLL